MGELNHDQVLSSRAMTRSEVVLPLDISIENRENKGMTKAIERYRFAMDWFNGIQNDPEPCAIACSTGAFVRYVDHTEVVSDLRKRIAALESDIERLTMFAM